MNVLDTSVLVYATGTDHPFAFLELLVEHPKLGAFDSVPAAAAIRAEVERLVQD